MHELKLHGASNLASLFFTPGVFLFSLVDYKTSSLFKWWHDNKGLLLAQVARRFLSATATSVPSKRLFSLAGIVYKEH